MPYNHDIKKLLNIKDENIEIIGVEETQKKGVRTSLVTAKLNSNIEHCPICGHSTLPNQKKCVIKNGTKPSSVLLNKAGNLKTVLKLFKQKFYCRSCESYFTAQTDLVDPYSFISNEVKFKAYQELAENQSMTNIAKHCAVSWSTIKRFLVTLIPLTKSNLNYLPKVLSMDEFKSLKGEDDKYAFSCIDGDSGRIIDILSSRKQEILRPYFQSYTLEARQNVKFIVTDMNKGYYDMTKSCFPNAQPIVDRFHIVQRINKAFDDIRIRIGKSLNSNNPEEAKKKRQLKRLNRLLKIPEERLDYTTFKRWQNFSWSYLTQSEVVDRLLAISEELKEAYFYYQEILDAYYQKNGDLLIQLVFKMPKNISPELQQIKTTFKSYEVGIRNALKYPYANGKIENLHTHIKNLKSTTYGFKNFRNMVTRIFLIRKIITIK